MQRESRVEEVDGSRGKKTTVKGTWNRGGKVRAVRIGSQALLHAAASMVRQRRQELEERVEVIRREVGEESRELRRLHAGGLKALDHVFHDDINHVYSVASA